MGWNMSCIIISPQQEIRDNLIFDALGLSYFSRLGDEIFDVAIDPTDDKLYIGEYKGNIIISVNTLPIAFFDPILSKMEDNLIGLFPESEISALSLQSSINHFGFAVIQNRKKVRAKAGDAQLGVIVDYGPPLEEELPLISRSKVNEVGERLYYLGTAEDQPILETQVGENFVFKISSRYIGVPFIEDDQLFDTPFRCYKINKEPFSPDHYFSGSWNGTYTLGDGYSEHTKGRKDSFALKMEISDGVLNGTCIDENKTSDAAATISGFVVNVFIGFTKQYPVQYYIDKNRNTQKDISKPSSLVMYSGLYDPLTDGFRGVWKIENTPAWGEWSMKRQE
jgi:hypothetical protein